MNILELTFEQLSQLKPYQINEQIFELKTNSGARITMPNGDPISLMSCLVYEELANLCAHNKEDLTKESYNELIHSVVVGLGLELAMQQAAQGEL